MHSHVRGWLSLRTVRANQSWHGSVAFTVGSWSRPLFITLFTASSLCAYICMLHTRAFTFTHPLRVGGAYSLHTTYSNTLLNIKGNYPSPWCMDLSEFLNQRNGLWTRLIPPGPVSRPLPGTPRRIRAVIPTFRFPLIWSWHRGDGLLCISPSQDGGLFTWSPPDWIWSVAHLLRRPLQLRRRNADFFFFFFFLSSAGICCIIMDEILFTEVYSL